MGIKRYELDEAQWLRIALFLPGKLRDPGRTGSDNRLFVNGVCGFCDQVHTGATCPSIMASGRPCIGVSAGGAMPVYGNECSTR